MTGKINKKLNTIEDNYNFLAKIGPRPIGSPNLNTAIKHFTREFSSLGYKPMIHDYPTIFWDFINIELKSNEYEIPIIPNPFSPSCDIKAQYVFITSLEKLKSISKEKVKDKILLLGGNLTKEILFPLNYTFYNVPEHQELYNLLNMLSPLAVIFISHSTFNPVAISQDIDFKIPSATISAENGVKILENNNKKISLKIETEITETKSSIIRGRLNSDIIPEVVLVAHLDSQFFSPGAHDDASGVLCLLQIMRLLQEEPSYLPIEFVITTGHEHTGDGEKLLLDRLNEENINLKYFFNIDGIGHKLIQDQISFYNVKEEIKTRVLKVQKDYGISEGPQWPQGLHGILAQAGTKCCAISSQSLDIHHTPKDNFDLLSLSKIKKCAEFIYRIIKIIEIIIIP